MQGLKAALQILSKNDETFKALCQPKVEPENIEVTEDNITVSWEPAPIEEVLSEWNQLKVESYDLMIHPAERKIDTVNKKGDEKKLEYVFENLKGGVVLLESRSNLCLEVA